MSTNSLKFVGAVLLLTISSFSFSQHHHSKEEFEKIEAAKIAHITQKVALTPAQAKDFWPLYNEYSEKRRELKHEKKDLVRNSDNLSDDKEILKTMSRIEDLREMELTLDKAYRKKFLLVLSPSQVMSLYRAEREFYRMIMRKIHEED